MHNVHNIKIVYVNVYLITQIALLQFNIVTMRKIVEKGYVMRITQVFGTNSRNANAMRYDFEHYNIMRSIYSAYNNPSYAKISAYNRLVNDYSDNQGKHTITVKGKELNLQYRHDIRVCGASSHFFSTIASFTDLDTGVIYLIKETHANTYMCEL